MLKPDLPLAVVVSRVSGGGQNPGDAVSDVAFLAAYEPTYCAVSGAVEGAVAGVVADAVEEVLGGGA